MKENVWKFSVCSILGVFVVFIFPFLLAEINHFRDLISDFHRFKSIIQSFNTLTAIKNTIIFMIITTPITVFGGFVLAYYVIENKFKKVVGISIITPIFIPSLATGVLFKFLYSVLFYRFFDLSLYLIIIYVWSTIGYTFLFYFISLKRRDKSIDEAAALDGASKLRLFLSVIVPTTYRTTVLSLVFSIYNAVRVFKYSYSLWGEYPDVSVYMIQNSLHNDLKELLIDKLMVSTNLFMIIIVLILLMIFSYERYEASRQGEDR